MELTIAIQTLSLTPIMLPLAIIAIVALCKVLIELP
jgi:hypothetical protein